MPFASARDVAIVGLVCVALALGLTWPLATRLTNALPSTLGDPLLNATILGWNVQWLLGQRDGAFWDAPIFHPHSNTLAYSEHLIAQTLMVWPVFALTDNAILTYNVALLFSFALSGMASYLWIHALTGRRDVAVVFALALTFSPFRMGAQLSRLQMLAIGWLPLAMWAIHRYAATTRTPYLAYLSASVVFLILSNMYMLFLAPLPLALVAAYSVLAAGTRWFHVARAIVGTIALSGMLLMPVFGPYRSLDREMGLSHDVDHTADYSAHLTSYASVHTDSPPLPWVPHTEGTGDQALYPGATLLLPLVAILAVGPRRSFAGNMQLALLYAAIGAVALWLSFGPEIRMADGTMVATSPYAWLRAYVPGFDAVRAPGRFAAIVSLSLAAVGALAWARLTARLTPNVRGVLAAAALAVVVLEAWPSALKVEPVSRDGRPVDRELIRWLAQQPAAAILELPASPLTVQEAHTELHHQFATLQHPHRLVNGYSGFNPRIADLLEDGESPFIDPARLSRGVALLRSLGVKYVVVHPHDYATPRLPVALIARMRMLEGVAAEHQIALHHVFEIAPE